MNEADSGVKRIPGSWPNSFMQIPRYATTNGRSKRRFREGSDAFALELHGNTSVYGFLWKIYFSPSTSARTLTYCSSDLTIFKNTRRLRRRNQRGYDLLFSLLLCLFFLLFSRGEETGSVGHFVWNKTRILK